MLLAVDIGNTNTVVALFEGKEIISRYRFPSNKTEIIKNLAALKGQYKDIVVSSVVPSLNSLYEEQKSFFVTKEVELGLKIKTDNPKEVGADRIVNSVAAKGFYNNPAIVIDFGTATTFDVIDNAGDYIGGVIAPGLRTSLKALSGAAEQLPELDFVKPNSVLGKNTKDAMLAGCYYGYIGLVENIIKELGEQFCSSCKKIATGGLAETFAKGSNVIDLVDNDLTLKGLYKIWTLNR